MQMIVLDLANTFSPYPAGRFPADGDHNGEKFRDAYLVPALKKAQATGDKVVVDIDGVRSFGSSFLEEAFAGLIRKQIFPRSFVLSHLKIRAEKPHLKFFQASIEKLLSEAVPETINDVRER